MSNLSVLFNKNFSDIEMEVKKSKQLKKNDSLPYPAEHYWLDAIMKELKHHGVEDDLAVYVGRFLSELKRANCKVSPEGIDALIVRTHLDGAYAVETQLNHLWKNPDDRKLTLRDKDFLQKKPSQKEEGDVEMKSLKSGVEQSNDQLRPSSRIIKYKNEISQLKEEHLTSTNNVSIKVH